MIGKALITADEIVRLEQYEERCAPTTLSMKECVSRFSETSVGSSAVTVSSIHTLWAHVVGEDVAMHVHVRHVRDGVLHVTSNHGAWATQLKYMESNIISQLNEHVAEPITSIRMSVTSS